MQTWVTGMGDIGTERREVEFEPVEEPARPEQQPAPQVPRREPVPA